MKKSKKVVGPRIFVGFSVLQKNKLNHGSELPGKHSTSAIPLFLSSTTT